ncbi:MAG: flagellar basal-body rod protein FlgG [Planctomycetota bacterium]|nr:flagellar basal-body rod protein FlgG [Planctomycetota bacterium]MDG1983127.1 flagellar basal-body rod protein FlgG [Planctomycetota bacterium]
MIRSLYTAASGMKAQQLQVDTIANNIANVNTSGFKKSRLSFRSLLYQTYREPGIPQANSQHDVTGLQIGSGTEVAGSSKEMQQGVLELTSNKYDLGIEGSGFFEVELPNGERHYTRNGTFRQDANGSLVTAEGYRLSDQVQIPDDAQGVSIALDGGVYAITEGNEQQQIGAIRLHVFPNPTGLRAMGGNYFAGTPSSGDPAAIQPTTGGAGMVKQGYLERSNVETVDELVSLIVAQRNYEVNSRAIRVSDEMLQQVNQLIR